MAEQEKHRKAIAADPSAAQRLRLQDRARAQSLLNRMFALAHGLQVNNGFTSDIVPPDTCIPRPWPT